MQKINILYLSNLCSPHIMDYLLSSSKIKPGQEAQKFHYLLTTGFSINDNCNIETLNVLPVISKSHSKRFWRVKSEMVGNVKYFYATFINLPFIKDFMTLTYSFIKVALWIRNYKKKDKVIICDILRLSSTLAALVICKLTKTKIIAIVTDIPGFMMFGQKQHSSKKSFINILGQALITKYDGYILLTEQMNSIVNPKNKPYIIMEGLVDVNMIHIKNVLDLKTKERILIYAGGIYERFGIKKLIDSFMKLADSDLRLHIFGPGDMQKDMPEYMVRDNRIQYFGIVPNQEVVDNELKATLLVNPRPTNEEFTKYSFPSKNMEYMVSGTPLITTQLPGMPEEYKQYVYMFEDESVEGLYCTLKSILAKPLIELHEFGIVAKSFVLKEKSNIVQASRILQFIDSHFINNNQ